MTRVRIVKPSNWDKITIPEYYEAFVEPSEVKEYIKTLHKTFPNITTVIEIKKRVNE